MARPEPSVPMLEFIKAELESLMLVPDSLAPKLGTIKDFIKLKFIIFSGCQSLVCMPDLDCTPNLEILDLYDCKNLERAHESVSHHNKLQFLNLGECSKLHHLPDMLQAKNLQLLNLNNCSNLQRLPDFSDKMKGLQGLNLCGTSIEGLPASIENLISLGEMHLCDCKKLAILPSSIYRLPNLEFLMLHGCSKLVKFPKREGDLSDPHMKMGFPKLQLLCLEKCNLSEVEFLENPSCFPSLNYLYLDRNNFNNLPTCKQQYKLPHLPVSYCQRIQEILDIPGQFQRQWALGCESLSERPSCLRDFDHIDFDSWHGRLHGKFEYSGFLNYKNYRYSLIPKNCQNVVPRGEMPEEFVLVEDGTISFMASQDLYDKFLGLALCVVFSVEDGKKEISFDIVPRINGERQNVLSGTLGSLDSNHTWIQYLRPNVLWGFLEGGVDFGQFDEVYLQFSLDVRVFGGTLQKLGYMIRCGRLEDDLKVVLEDKKSVNPASLYEEDSDEPNSLREGRFRRRINLKALV